MEYLVNILEAYSWSVEVTAIAVTVIAVTAIIVLREDIGYAIRNRGISVEKGDVRARVYDIDKKVEKVKKKIVTNSKDHESANNLLFKRINDLALRLSKLEEPSAEKIEFRGAIPINPVWEHFVSGNVDDISSLDNANREKYLSYFKDELKIAGGPTLVNTLSAASGSPLSLTFDILKNDPSGEVTLTKDDEGNWRVSIRPQSEDKTKK